MKEKMYDFRHDIAGAFVIKPMYKSLTGTENPPLLEAVAEAQAIDSRRDLVIDLSGIEMMTSKGLGQLLASLNLYQKPSADKKAARTRTYAESQSQLRACAANDRVAAIMKVTGASQLLPDYRMPLESILSDYTSSQ